MARHLLIAFPLIVILAACGTAQPVAQAPAEVTRVVTQVVPRVVTQIATRIVVVTATPQPTEPTDAPTSAPEPTVVEPTSAPESTRIPEPTAPAELAAGDVIAKIIRTINVYEAPDENNYKSVASASPGTRVRVLYRGGQWFQITWQIDGEERKGWVYRDWTDIPADVAERIPLYPDALPVLVGKLTQTISYGKDYWTGTVFNVGSQMAKDVEVKISLIGYGGGSQTLAAQGKALVVGKDLTAGQHAKFKVVTDYVGTEDSHYEVKVLWSVK